MHRSLHLHVLAFAFYSPTMKTIVDKARLKYNVETVQLNSSISSTHFAIQVEVGAYTLMIDILDEDRVSCRIETQSDTFQNLYIMSISFV